MEMNSWKTGEKLTIRNTVWITTFLRAKLNEIYFFSHSIPLVWAANRIRRSTDGCKTIEWSNYYGSLTAGDQLHQFVCAANSFRLVIPEFAKTVQPLAAVLKFVCTKIGIGRKSKLVKYNLENHLGMLLS